jgi:hypothetical protein
MMAAWASVIWASSFLSAEPYLHCLSVDWQWDKAGLARVAAIDRPLFFAGSNA